MERRIHFSMFTLPFFTSRMDLIVNNSEGLLICGADFNTHLQPPLDISSQKANSKAMNKKFCNLLENIGLIDIWREINPKARQYTHVSNPIRYIQG